MSNVFSDPTFAQLHQLTSCSFLFPTSDRRVILKERNYFWFCGLQALLNKTITILVL